MIRWNIGGAKIFPFPQDEIDRNHGGLYKTHNRANILDSYLIIFRLQAMFCKQQADFDLPVAFK
jgi:hypothetical protein